VEELLVLEQTLDDVGGADGADLLVGGLAVGHGRVAWVPKAHTG
jgi:hypothetical protein